jgi:tetratricopeptide (TPR) repeat protein
MPSKISPQPGILSEEPTLSVCMIVRDEEKTLPRCLASVKDFADEIVVVDTGSNDRTISIARSFKATVFHFTWCDDFSAARNVYLKHATSDWILQIDADEELLPESVPIMQERLLDPWCILCTITVDNGSAYPDRFFHPGRLFRNHPKLRYSRPYHETLRQSERKLRRADPRWQIVHEPRIILRHYGYDESRMKEQEKLIREIRILESYVKDNPKDQDMTIRLAEVYTWVGQSQKAIDACKRVLGNQPDFARAHHALGAAYWKEGIFDKAMVEFKETLSIDPGFGFAHYRLGAAYCIEGNLDLAIRELKEALAIEPHFALAHHWLGVSYCKKDMIEEGIEEFKQALAMDPDLALAHYWLGAAYNKKAWFREAIIAFKRALGIDPHVDERLPHNLANAHANLGAVLHSQGQLDEAIQEYQHVLSLNAEDGETRYNLGAAYEAKGMVEEAMVHFMESIAIDPALAQAHYGLARLYLSKKQHVLAIKHCDEALKLGFEVPTGLLDDLKPHRREMT